MRLRRIAILIDGGFFVKRLSRLVGEENCRTPQDVAKWAQRISMNHVRRLTREPCHRRDSRWLDHVYRMFYYDATPWEGVAHNPFSNLQVKFANSEEARFRHELFAALRKQRKFALRLGHVAKEDGWRLKDPGTEKKLLRTFQQIETLDMLVSIAEGEKSAEDIDPDKLQDAKRILDLWRGLDGDAIKFGLRQKGVDIRIGVDITSLTLKRQVDTIILVTGDCDFVPAAKLARREGVEFILDPMRQNVSSDLDEHIDGMYSGLGLGRDRQDENNESGV